MHTEVVSANSVDVFVIELGEDEGGAAYLGGSVGVADEVLEGGPALGEQGEPAFSPPAQAAR
jgi:hypothetical protein